MSAFCLVIHDRRSTYEINSNGRDVGLGVGIIGESQKQAGLSDA